MDDLSHVELVFLPRLLERSPDQEIGDLDVLLDVLVLLHDQVLRDFEIALLLLELVRGLAQPQKLLHVHRGVRIDALAFPGDAQEFVLVHAAGDFVLFGVGSPLKL